MGETLPSLKIGAGYTTRHLGNKTVGGEELEASAGFTVYDGPFSMTQLFFFNHAAPSSSLLGGSDTSHIETYGARLIAGYAPFHWLHRPVSFNLSVGTGVATYDEAKGRQAIGNGPHFEAGGLVCFLGDIVCGSAALTIDLDVATTYQSMPERFPVEKPHDFNPSNNTHRDQGLPFHNSDARPHHKIPPTQQNSDVTGTNVGVMIDVAKMLTD